MKLGKPKPSPDTGQPSGGAWFGTMPSTFGGYTPPDKGDGAWDPTIGYLFILVLVELAAVACLSHLVERAGR